ncbi:hypothetical protein GGF50DRAFT_87903 [Schizophyllum commune]
MPLFKSSKSRDPEHGRREKADLPEQGVRTEAEMNKDKKDREYVQSVNDATQFAKTRAQESSFQRKVDDFEDRTLSKIPSGADAVVENASDMKELASTFKDRMEGYMGSGCDLLLKALEEVSALHPYVNVALFAFKAVVKVERTRRENDSKVTMLGTQMYDMMETLKPLVGIHPDHVESKLKSLMEKISKDVFQCGHFCDTYTKKRLIVKFVKSSVYEQHLADFSERFKNARDEIRSVLAVHTATTVTMVRSTLDVNMQEIRQLFQHLESSRERDMRQLINKYGADLVVKDDDKLRELMMKEKGELAAGSQSLGKGGRDQQELLYLKEDLRERLEESLSKTADQYFGKLKGLKDEIISAIVELGNTVRQQVVADLQKGPHERIEDEDIRELWKEMHWRNSVKAHHFTLALRDHVIERFYDIHGSAHVHRLRTDDAALDPNAGTSDTESPPDFAHAMADVPQAVDDDDNDTEQWAISVFTMLTVQPISEALDDDGTGFVSTLEINTFTSSRPKEWSLLRWFVYWGEGWYASLLEYRLKILHIMQVMYEVLDTLHPANRSAVDLYLNHYAFRRVELLMRGLDTSRSCADRRVIERFRSYTEQEEERLETSLANVGYAIDDTFTLEIVKGPGRIERYIYPLVYLTLRHHLMLIQKGVSSLLDETVLTKATGTLLWLMNTVAERVLRLKAIMRHPKVDGHSRLMTYAYGTLQYFADTDYLDRSPEDNILRFNYSMYGDDDYEAGDIAAFAGSSVPGQSDKGDAAADGDTSDVGEGPASEPDDGASISTNLDVLPPQTRPLPSTYDDSGYAIQSSMAASTTGSSVCGTWTTPGGLFYGGPHLGYIPGLLVISLSIDATSSISGRGYTAFFDCTISGAQEPGDNGLITLRFEFSAVPWVSSTASFSLSLEGRYLETDETLFCSGDTGEDVWKFVRTPPDVFAIRPPPGPQEDKRYLWSFARDSILHRIRRQLQTKDYVLRWVKQLNRIENPQDNGDYMHISPADARFFFSVVVLHRRELRIHFNAWCNACGKIITNDRYACLECTEDGLRDQIDLCAGCRRHMPTFGKFVHKPSHTLVRIRYHLHNKDKKAVYDTAKEAIERIKMESGHCLEVIPEEQSGMKSRACTIPKKVCVACGGSIRLPSYYCCGCYIDKKIDVYGCDFCLEMGHLELTHDDYERAHHFWIVVKEDALRPKLSMIEMQLKAMEQRFSAMDSRMAQLERLLEMAVAARHAEAA